MAQNYMNMVLTPAVREAQDKYFGRHQWVENAPAIDTLTPEETEFIEARDSFYMATITENSWPYVQHRGGPVGFVHVLGSNLLGFADFKGNRQLVSTGNLSRTDRVALFMMDYPKGERLKLFGHVKVLDARDHQDLAAQLAHESLRMKVERVFLIDVVGYDWNCGQYITPRYDVAYMERQLAPLKTRIAELEAENAALRRGEVSNDQNSRSLRK
jgi:predicted pyridoxine 5'-phosphate oxidase superfamily flavin-nucleotide-binding protein